MKGQFATRICGSPDLYEENGRGPCHSINFITAHDGFTLRYLDGRGRCRGLFGISMMPVDEKNMQFCDVVWV